MPDHNETENHLFTVHTLYAAITTVIIMTLLIVALRYTLTWLFDVIALFDASYALPQ